MIYEQELKKNEEMRLCTLCKINKFKALKKDKQRKHCDDCCRRLNPYKSQKMWRTREFNKIKETFMTTGNISIIHTGGYFGITHKKTEKISTTFKTFTIDKVLNALESMKKDIENNIKLIKNEN